MEVKSESLVKCFSVLFAFDWSILWLFSLAEALQKLPALSCCTDPCASSLSLFNDDDEVDDDRLACEDIGLRSSVFGPDEDEEEDEVDGTFSMTSRTLPFSFYHEFQSQST